MNTLAGAFCITQGGYYVLAICLSSYLAWRLCAVYPFAAKAANYGRVRAYAPELVRKSYHVSKSKSWFQLDLNLGQHNHNITTKVRLIMCCYSTMGNWYCCLEEIYFLEKELDCSWLIKL